MNNDQDWTPPHGIPRPSQRPGVWETTARAAFKLSVWILAGVIVWALIVGIVVGTWKAVTP